MYHVHVFRIGQKTFLSILRFLSVKFIKAVKCSSLILDEQKLILDSIKERNFLAECQQFVHDYTYRYIL
jgi:hypothetical protein